MIKARKKRCKARRLQASVALSSLIAVGMSGPAFAREKVQVTDAQGGCVYDADAGYSLRQTDKGFGHGKKSLSTEETGRLREVLLTAEDGREGLMQSLGITEETIEAQRETILNAALQDDSVTPRVLPADLQQLLEFDAVRDVVFKELDAGTSDSVIISTSWCHFSVELPGEPSVVASSRSCRPWMLPWTIRAGDREWRTWSTAVPEALRQLAPKESPNSRLLNGARYWREGFWSDSSVWRGSLQDGVGVQLNAYHGRKLAVDLDGWSAASAHFELVEAETGLINSCSLSLAVTAKPLQVVSIDRIRWYNKLEEGVPRVGWDRLVALRTEAETAIARNPWLADWRSHEGEILLVAHNALGRSCQSLEKWVLPAWRDAGNSGVPEFELQLSGPKQGYAKVYIGADDSAAVITYAGVKGMGKHWLYGREVSFHPSKPEYLLVVPDGRVKRRRVAGE